MRETRANANNIQYVNIPGYNFYCNNSATKAGGSGIYGVNSLTCSELLNLQLNLHMCDELWAENQLVPKTLLGDWLCVSSPSTKF